MDKPKLTIPRFQPALKLRRIARERKHFLMSRQFQGHHRFLVPGQDHNHWSMSSGKYGKDRIPALVTGKEAPRSKTDSEKMEMHLEYLSLSMAIYPWNEKDGIHFNPLEVPILDILAMEADQKFGWKYPSQGILKQF